MPELQEETPIFVERSTCRICGHPVLIDVLDLGFQEIANFVDPNVIELPSAPLVMCRCGECGLLQLKHTTRPDLLWGEKYWYRSGINQTMHAALHDVIDTAIAWAPPGGVWLDIGANDGTLLSQVPERFTRIACEPCKIFRDGLEGIAEATIPDFFSAKYEVLLDAKNHGNCAVVTSCAMFYDVDDPDRFLEDIVKVLAPRGIWVNQLTLAEDMIEYNAWDGICHEHRVYYSLYDIRELYARHGLEILDVSRNSVNGGSFRIVAKAGTPKPKIPKTISSEQVQGFAERARRWRDVIQDMLPRGGKLWGYGASTKGCCLLQYGGIAPLGVAERNAQKVGLVMAGMRCPIISEDELRAKNPEYVIVLPWAFEEEFLRRESEMRKRGTTMIFPLPNPKAVL